MRIPELPEKCPEVGTRNKPCEWQTTTWLLPRDAILRNDHTTRDASSAVLMFGNVPCIKSLRLHSKVGRLDSWCSTLLQRSEITLLWDGRHTFWSKDKVLNCRSLIMLIAKNVLEATLNSALRRQCQTQTSCPSAKCTARSSLTQGLFDSRCPFDVHSAPGASDHAYPFIYWYRSCEFLIRHTAGKAQTGSRLLDLDFKTHELGNAMTRNE